MSSHETVRVDLGPRGYDIIVGDDVLAEAGKSMAPILRAPRVIVITDNHVAPLHLDALMRSLANAEIAAEAIVLPAGEQTKNFTHFEKLLGEILGRGIDRDISLVALGGGVIGDITGFAAASVLRGIDFIQAPTTLLAQVDSSVGGKTGINSPHGKNLIGAFHQPRLVLADSRVLRTLPRREMLAGYAEVVKYGLINDPAFFAWLEGHGADLVDGDPAKVRRAVVASCRAKAAIVAEDEQERGARAAESGAYIRPCAGGRNRFWPYAAAWRGGGDRHGDGLRPVGAHGALPGRGCGQGAPASRCRRPAHRHQFYQFDGLEPQTADRPYGEGQEGVGG